MWNQADHWADMSCFDGVTAAAAAAELAGSSVAALRQRAREAGVSLAGCAEKADIIERLVGGGGGGGDRSVAQTAVDLLATATSRVQAENVRLQALRQINEEATHLDDLIQKQVRGFH